MIVLKNILPFPNWTQLCSEKQSYCQNLSSPASLPTSVIFLILTHSGQPSLSFCLSLSLSVHLSFSISILFVSISLSMSISLSLSFFQSLSLSIYIVFTISLSIFLSPSLSTSPPPSLLPCISHLPHTHTSAVPINTCVW